MKYVNLGRSGLKVSRLCLGCMSYGEPERLPQPWSLDEKASRPLIRQALEAGINFFDTANIYSGGSSEEITGKALRFGPAVSDNKQLAMPGADRQACRFKVTAFVAVRQHNLPNRQSVAVEDHDAALA